jgi:fragile X mental retardation protein
MTSQPTRALLTFNFCSMEIVTINCFLFLQEVEQLRQEKLEIDQQLRSIHGTALGSMQSLSMGRRNDRGYNSDMDGGGRPGRGSMRGRGGRGRGGGPGGRQNDRYNSGSSTITDYVNNVDKRNHTANKPTGNGRGGGRGGGHASSNGRPPRGGGGSGPPTNNRERPNKGRLSIDSAGGGDRGERK